MFGGYLRPYHIESYLSRHSGGGGGGAAPAPQENLLSNEDPAGWFKPGLELRPVSDKGPVDGKPAYAFVAKDPTTSQLIYMAKNNFPDKGYFSIWAKGMGKFVMMVQRRAGGWNIYGQKQFDLTSDWKQYTVQYTASGYDPADTIGFKIDTGGTAKSPTDMLVSAPSLYDQPPAAQPQGPQPKTWKNVATDPLSNTPGGEVEVARNYILNPRMINATTVLGDAASISVSAPNKSPLDTPAVAVRPAGNKTKSNAWFSYSDSSQVPTTGYFSAYVKRSTPGTSRATLFVQQRGGSWTKYSEKVFTITDQWQRLILPYDISANPTHTGVGFNVGFLGSDENPDPVLISMACLSEIDGYFDGEYNSWQANDLTPSWTGTPNGSASVLKGQTSQAVQAISGQTINWISSDNPEHPGETFTRIMAVADGPKGINLTDSNLPVDKTSTIHIRPQNQMKVTAQWAAGKNTGEKDLSPQWQTITAKGGAGIPGGVQFLYNQTTGWKKGEFVDVGRHMTIAGDYNGDFFTGTKTEQPPTPVGDGSVKDRWMAWLKSQGATGYHLHALEISWLQKLGHTGTFADMVIQKWKTKDALRDWFLNN